MILDRQPMSVRPPPLKEGPVDADKNAAAVWELGNAVEWTEADRARWRDAHKPWWEPLQG